MKAIAAVLVAAAMLAPKLLKEFHADSEILRTRMRTARLNLQAKRAIDLNKRTWKRTNLAALEVGRALHRMFSTGNWTENHASWASLCRHHSIPRQDSYELMNDAGVHDKLPAAVLALIPDGLTRKESRALAHADPEEREQALQEAVETGDVAKALEGLTRSSIWPAA